MCEFCIKHGEGKKWYEIMDHYSKELLSDKSRQEYINRFIKSIRTNAQPNIERLKLAKNKLPIAYRFIRKVATASMKNNHFGQVIPLEDAVKIVDMVQSITRIACVCRSVTTSKNNARYCLLLGIDPSGSINDWPELESSMETLTSEEAKELLQEFDQKGLVHTIWTFKTPFIGAICNCSPDCLAYEIQVGSDLMNLMFKAEYTAKIDPLLCVGCKSCRRQCQFDAVEYSTLDNKCYINPLKCYGCGLCRNPCKKNAITLLEKENPAV